MAKSIKKLARALGATLVGQVPDTGVGAFGAARLSHIVADLQRRLEPGQGRRPGRPTVASWAYHPKVPMSAHTRRKLERLARRASGEGRKVSPMQLAARLLEEAVIHCPDA
jgi:hypothetical protein